MRLKPRNYVNTDVLPSTCEHHTLPDLLLHPLGYDSPHVSGEVLLLLLILSSSLAVIVIELPHASFR